MNSNIRRHIIHDIKHDTKHYIIHCLRKYGYVGPDNEVLSCAMFDAYGQHVYNPVHFREFWHFMCLPAILTAFSCTVSRYEDLKNYEAAKDWAHLFICEQVEQYMYR